MKSNIIKLPPNRVRRNYLGGLLLDRLSGKVDPADGNQPEEWIASTIEARNPGLDVVPNEGLAYTINQGEAVFLKDLFAQDPEFYLGKNHHDKLGNDLGFLAKLLDSSMRLHLQAHPSAAFAQEHLNSRWGKLETYYILGTRPGYEGYIWLGFQNPPSKQEWERIVIDQDLEAMHKCFEKIPVEQGQVWVIPGGMPHAIGEGLLVMEVMEPTDLVVRCEFERNGIIVPPEARFMGMEPKASLEIFDFTKYSVQDVKNKCIVQPTALEKSDQGIHELLIGEKQTECFNIHRIITSNSYDYQKSAIIHIGIVSKGQGAITIENETVSLQEGSTFLIPAAVKSIPIISTSDNDLEILFCTPGYDLERFR
ncbi:MAG: mannose-6-phosphate isomerase [Planctomycetota bacterium]|nr:MAG: mannose-6-phosphate isomerase [Planctomycetota bacterium]